jgi:D-alanyl-D-alanine carboxypeptidase/D-alanyl-D-alanine-endopeptidase (penicillin-binding protein 4)
MREAGRSRSAGHQRLGRVLACGALALLAATAAHAAEGRRTRPKAKPSVPTAATPQARIEAAVLAVQRVAKDVGVHIVRLDDGATIFGLDQDHARVVASNNKLFTTAAALATLGPAYEYETKVLARGTIADGTLDGDLAVVGAGDPNISGRGYNGDIYAIFRSWAASLKSRGIQHVHGRLHLVTGFFDAEQIHPDWPKDQLVRWYEAPVDDLSFNENVVLVRVFPGRKPGAPVRVETEPPLPSFGVINNGITTGSRSRQRLTIGRTADNNNIYVSGAMYVGSGPSEAQVTVTDPVGVFGDALRDALKQEGVTIDGDTLRSDHLGEGSWSEVAELRSSLLSTIDITNKHSQNFFAETLCKLLGRTRFGEGSWQAGTRAVSEFLTKVGLVPGSYTLADGSGMSRNNRFAPSQVTRLLQYMYSQPFGADFMRSLAYSGERGLRWQRRLASGPYLGNVFAKTGTLSGVSALSGYVKAKSGKLYVFSILCNGVRGNAPGAQDAIVRALIDNG